MKPYRAERIYINDPDEESDNSFFLMNPSQPKIEFKRLGQSEESDTSLLIIQEEIENRE